MLDKEVKRKISKRTLYRGICISHETSEFMYGGEVTIYTWHRGFTKVQSQTLDHAKRTIDQQKNRENGLR